MKIISREFLIIFAQNIDCGYTLELFRRDGSNEYQQSMFWSKNKKNRYTPANPILLHKNGASGGFHCTDMFSLFHANNIQTVTLRKSV